MEIITTSSGKNYIYEHRTGYISLVPGSHVSDVNKASYFSDKIKYLTSHGLISTNQESEYKQLELRDIKEALINTHQIIFEVTDKCNLNCYYCGYGQFYDNYDARNNQDLSVDVFKTLYNYLNELWESNPNKGCTYLRISFYGGEPLCNFSFIKDAVDYVKSNPIQNKRIIFSMTTNAVLIDQYMDFLVNNNFEILISLDGDKYNDSYRVYKDGNSSFEKVLSNIDKLYSSHPLYFSRNIRFNSVLHNRNSIKDASTFIYTRYQKFPITNELNIFGVSKAKCADFAKMFHSKVKEFSSMTIEEKRRYESQSPFIHNCKKWVFDTLMKTYSVNLMKALSEGYANTHIYNNLKIPTKTCVPFSRKIFVSVSGGIYPCERIGNELNFGNIYNGKVEIAFDRIISQYNLMLSKYIDMCKSCKAKDFCSVCIVSDIHGHEVCSRMKPRNISEYISFFEEMPEILRNFCKTISVI